MPLTRIRPLRPTQRTGNRHGEEVHQCPHSPGPRATHRRREARGLYQRAVRNRRAPPATGRGSPLRSPVRHGPSLQGDRCRLESVIAMPRNLRSDVVDSIATPYGPSRPADGHVEFCRKALYYWLDAVFRLSLEGQLSAVSLSSVVRETGRSGLRLAWTGEFMLETEMPATPEANKAALWDITSVPRGLDRGLVTTPCWRSAELNLERADPRTGQGMSRVTTVGRRQSSGRLTGSHATLSLHKPPVRELLALSDG